jgi:hypothetical protein
VIRNSTRFSPPRSLVIAALTCAGAAALLIALCAAAVRLTGMADEVRHTLQLSFDGVERTRTEALRIALQNGRIATATLLCALAVRRLPEPVRAIVDVILAVVLALNAAAIGLALGAYGERLMVATAAHAPIELAALSLAGAAYVSARRQPVSPRALAAVASSSLALLAGAALAETYVSGGAS